MHTLLETIESHLAYLTKIYSEDTSPLLAQSIQHVLLNPGKRIRPLLTLLTVQSLQGNISHALSPACALEILHTYSLVHDDLPCMDDDALRRGKPTLHTLYGEGQAVLVGDLLLTLVFEIISHSVDLAPSTILSLIQTLAKRSGGHGMIQGQSLDLLAEKESISLPALIHIHQRKTADLLSCSLEFGGILSQASPALCQGLYQIGQEIGLAFQIIDDVLDAEGDPSLLGKPLHSDLDNAKSTFWSLLGKKESLSLAQTHLENALEQGKQWGLASSPLLTFLPTLVHRLF